MTDDTGYEVILYRKGTAGTITLSKATADATIGGGIMARPFEHDENNVSNVTLTLDNASIVAAENLLSSSCALWSNSVTGALQMGDYVRYSVYPTSTGTKTQVFYGKITEMRPMAGGMLQVIAADYLQKFNRENNKTVFSNYRDLMIKPYIDSAGLRAITGITEPDITLPMVRVGFATTDIRISLSGTGTYLDPLWDTVDFWTDAQAFMSQGDALIGLQYHYQSVNITTSGNIHCAIQGDNDGVPTGVDIAYHDYDVGLGTNINTAVLVDFTNAASEPVQLKRATKYWVVWKCDATIIGDLVAIVFHAGVAANPFTDRYWYKKVTGGTWTESIADRNMNLRFDFTNYDEVPPDKYMFDAPNDRILFASNDIPITTVDTYYTLYRGNVSYYYNTITHQNICDALAGLVGDIYSWTSGNQLITFNTYNTVGKKLIDCFKELADVWETSGSWSGYQHAFAHQEISGVQYIGWGKRLSLGDTPAAFTFNYGTDGVVDNEHRIIDYTGLVKQTDVRPATIRIIGGKDANGNPIVLTVSDKALAGGTSFATQMEDFTNMEKISDQNIVTLTDGFRRGYAAIDSYRRNTWEGTIRVSGVYPDLFDITWGSGSFGSGKIVGLTISPLGIFQELFKVRGIVVHENETEITLSNIWSNIENRPSKTFLKTDRTEAFIAEVGTAVNLYFACHVNTAFITTPVYMAFMDASFNQLSAWPVLCALYRSADYSGNSDLNLYIYHAEFEAGNGFTIDGTPITELGLFAADGTPLLYYDLVSGLRNESFYKWKTQRLIVDFSTKAA